MKAWRFYAFGDLRLDELPMPQVKPGWVLLKTRVIQMSVTEAMLAKGVPTVSFQAVKKRLDDEAPVQLFGHEFCASVVEVGEGVKGVEVGDRVTARNALPCGACGACLSGRSDMCRSLRIIGMHIPGCLGEYGTVPAEVLTKVPESVSDNEAACSQPLSEAVEAVASAHLELGDTCVVIGSGTMGLGCIQAAKASGAGTVIATDVRSEALDLARQMGADVVLDPHKSNPLEAILDLTDGLGADIVFETAGGPQEQGLGGYATLDQSVEVARTKGKIILIAHLGTKGEINFDRCRMKSVQLIFPDMGAKRFMEHTVRLMASGKLTVKPTITHVLHGLENVPEAIEITANKGKYGAINPAQVVVD
ncbi:MAG: zinc-binding dehydrogenase [Dehalococcoidia bacterium]|nr:zinc-binding dehydrogenase [Dehalococcoidia bacterium]